MYWYGDNRAIIVGVKKRDFNDHPVQVSVMFLDRVQVVASF